MSSVRIEIPEEIVTLLKGSRLGGRPVADQVRIALAIHLFQEGVISAGKAAAIADEPRATSELLLSDVGVPPVRYGQEEYRQDREAFARARQRRG